MNFSPKNAIHAIAFAGTILLGSAAALAGFDDGILRYEYADPYGSSYNVYVAGLQDASATLVTIPATVMDGEKTCYVTSIRGSAFAGCSGLTSVTIPGSVTNIGANAFSSCSGLTDVDISDSVTSIGADAFFGCSGLISVHIHDLAAWCGISFAGSAWGVDPYWKPFGYSYHLVLDGEEVANLVIPDGVTSIGDYAFSGCSSLTSVTIPDSVTCIGLSAFSCCSGLTDVTIPEGVADIGRYAFASSGSLTNVTIPEGVVLSTTTFEGCNALWT